MIKLCLTLNNGQREELKSHLENNGYEVEWVSEDVIMVNEEEIAYVRTILSDRNIGFVDNRDE